MTSSLRLLLHKIIATGSLRLTDHSGATETYGDGSGKAVAIRFTDEEAEEAVANDPLLKLGEMYMDGRMVLEEGDIYDFLALVKENTRSEALTWKMVGLTVARIAAAQVRSRLPVNHNRRNVAHHYDLNARLFDLFLDRDWQYSCAYFNPPGISLDEAQQAKKRHIASKLLLEPGQKVLEIGSGWGGMAMYLAEAAAVDVTGITLSEEQLRVSRNRAEKRALADTVRFKLQDYRYLPPQKYDRIVSVGMFEHVGIGNYGRFFGKVAEVLDDNGVMLLHSIGRPKPSYVTNPFIEKYIFPGGYIPAVGEVLPAIEKADLLIRDVEILPLHYGHTLRHWRERFVARKEEAVALYDERFFRMWEFYLAGSEMAFTHEELFIFQIQIARNQNVVPDNRDYIAEAEARYRTFEAGRPPLEPVAF
ncbi:cyclopropane-fatty-acyl-phospholipid synthase family protein [Rhizobiaceae bacterium BDR2-2]|uniref:Cyclopropane-fatty-acyl-phospholipid synthase family protein n=1 Tax=Ectorhizobium quercum TaxID=2965071 RepID=A0AAE3SXL2_9HYPH|nr:cyclopropane-fatty-acyl-phospholipid synthase family protein [Ectorhizobium quercum]MCX8996341.1 cyclopropane-fatty-acyl-phospholipid synthase family protein [Ectorhizobium quercum]MCX8998620.1 cyclopropane-fatty-acyl-phospholipid synthase family protein [Ectorhizobium quercum]